MPSDTEREVFEELCEAEDAADIFKAVEQLNTEQRTAESETLITAAGHMMGEALLHESLKNKYE